MASFLESINKHVPRLYESFYRKQLLDEGAEQRGRYERELEAYRNSQNQPPAGTESPSMAPPPGTPPMDAGGQGNQPQGGVELGIPSDVVNRNNGAGMMSGIAGMGAPPRSGHQGGGLPPTPGHQPSLVYQPPPVDPRVPGLREDWAKLEQDRKNRADQYERYGERYGWNPYFEPQPDAPPALPGKPTFDDHNEYTFVTYPDGTTSVLRTGDPSEAKYKYLETVGEDGRPMLQPGLVQRPYWMEPPSEFEREPTPKHPSGSGSGRSRDDNKDPLHGRHIYGEMVGFLNNGRTEAARNAATEYLAAGTQLNSGNAMAYLSQIEDAVAVGITVDEYIGAFGNVEPGLESKLRAVYEAWMMAQDSDKGGGIWGRGN